MGCRVLYDRDEEMAALYCSTSGVAFGPLFHPTADETAGEVAERYLDSHRDPRHLSERDLAESVARFLDLVRCTACDGSGMVESEDPPPRGYFPALSDSRAPCRSCDETGWVRP